MNTFWDNVLRVVAVVGLLAVLLLGAWGIIQLAFFIPSFFSNLGNSVGSLFNKAPAQESLTISLPSSATSQQPFVVNWSHTGKSGEYSYQLSYACADGLSVVAPTPAGSFAKVACNTPFNYINASTSMPVVAIVADKTKTAKLDVTVSATKLDSGTITKTAKGSTTVQAAASTQTTTTKPATTKPKPSTSTTPNASYVSAGNRTNLYGYADLAVYITSAYSQSGRATLQFAIQNVGTNVSASNWTFNAVLPINGGYTYQSAPQQALYPGDKIVYSLGFGDYTYGNDNYYFNSQPSYDSGCGQYYPDPSNYVHAFIYPCLGNGSAYNYNYYNPSKIVSVQVDPYNYLYELNKYNNSATASYIAY